jgi:hypothetical protein
MYQAGELIDTAGGSGRIITTVVIDGTKIYIVNLDDPFEIERTGMIYKFSSVLVHPGNVYTFIKKIEDNNMNWS